MGAPHLRALSTLAAPCRREAAARKGLGRPEAGRSGDGRTARRSRLRWPASYLHSSPDDIHGIGEDGSGGCGQGACYGLKDNVRTLLGTEVRELLWNGGETVPSARGATRPPSRGSCPAARGDALRALPPNTPNPTTPAFSPRFLLNQQRVINLRPVPAVILVMSLLSNRTKCPREGGFGTSGGQKPSPRRKARACAPLPRLTGEESARGPFVLCASSSRWDALATLAVRGRGPGGRGG